MTDGELLARIDERVGMILARLKEGDQRFEVCEKRIANLEHWRWFLAGGLAVVAVLLKLMVS